MNRRRVRRIVPAVALALAASIVVAWAFWSATGAGSASAGTGSLDAATISVPANAVNTVTVTWSQQASLVPASAENSAITYSVERKLDAGAYAPVTSGGCSGAKPHGTTSCEDTPPGAGSYTYRVVATYNSWTATSSEAGPVAVSDTAAPTVDAEVTPAPNAAGWNNTSPVSVALSADDGGGSGVASIEYTTDGSDPTTSLTAQVYTTPFSIAATTTVKYFATDVAGNASAVETQPVKIDTGAPANAITLSDISGGAFKSGTTVYYRGAASGSFTLTNAVSDGNSGPASSETSALSGTLTGWTHNPSLVSTPAGGPYVSSAFSWSALTMSSPTETVTGSDAADNTATTELTFTDDSVAPAGGSVDATGLGGTGGRYSTSTTLSIEFTAGTDSGSGLATSGAQLLRASARLGDGSCGSYGTYTQVGAGDPTSPVADTVPVDHTCYRYRYVVSDRVGNQATYTSPDIKVDTDAPHPDFLQPITSPETARVGPAGLAAGDVDNDGDQDIVTSAIFESQTSVLINDGVGAFREQTVASNAATIDAGLGKFDNDSNLDLVLLYQGSPPGTGLLVIFKGGGDGTFTYMYAANEIVNTGVRSTSLAVGNFNGDAIDDVAVVNSQNNTSMDVGTVMTYLGGGNDNFAAAAPAQTLNAQIGATDIAYADFNGGAKDLVVTNSASNSITFLAGNGTGFNAPANIPAGAPLAFLDTANLDSGTNRDIVATVRDSNPSAVRTLFGDGAGGFPTQATTTAAAAGTGDTPQAVVAKDFDNDADVDVAIANASPSTVSVLANDGTGAFTIAPASPEVGVGGAGTVPYGLVSADFDGSGYNDLAATPVFTSPGEVRTLLNQNGDRADLSITQTDSPDPVPGGQDLTYTLTVANASASTPSSVKARNKLPAGVTFNAAASSPSCSAAGSAPVTVTCDYGAVASGSPESRQIVVTTGASTPSSLTNTATVAGNLADPTPGNNAATATTTVTDTFGPTGGSVDASGLVGTGARYSTSTALSIVLSKGSDPSGLATTGAQLRRSTATLTSGGVANGSCGSYDASVQIGADDPVSPVADTVPAGQACYRYEYVVADTLGNTTTYTSPDIKIDTTAPATPTLAFSALTNTYWNGSTLYYRSDAISGAFTVTASSTDANSGIASYAFPTLPAGWSATPGALGVNTYSWSAPNPTAPSGAQNATAANNATLNSAAALFTMASDITAPATGTVGYTDGYYSSASVSVSFTKGTDGGSGVNATSGLLQRASAPLQAGGTCGSYGAFATVTGGTNPASPFTDTGVTSGNCYQYRYLVSDNVGNQATYTSASVAKVDTAAPTISRAVAAKTDGSTPGTIRQGGAYYVYAQVTDNASVSTVTANTSSFDTGVTAASLSSAGGPWTIGGQSYNYRSASLTADTPLTTGTTPSYTVTATDAATNTAGPTSFTATIETYNSVITGTSGLVSYWRLDDGAMAGDEFTDTAGTLLSSHTGALGASWTSVPSQDRTAVITNANRLRKETGNGAAQYYASATPPSANYLVEADVHVASLLGTDAIAVVGRQDVSGTGQTFYIARYVRDSARWELGKVVNGTLTLIGSGTGTGYYSQTLTTGTSYRMTLQMNGTAISLLVDGVSRITATDSSISAAGRAGVRLGTGASTAQTSDSAGLHLDDFRVSSLTTSATDSQGTNNGTYNGGVSLNQPAGLAGETDRTVTFDGVNDYVRVTRQIQDNFSIEFWFRSTQGLNTNSQWWGNAGLVDAEVSGAANDFGVSLRSDGRITAGTGSPDVSIVSSSGGYNDGNWHHVVFTRIRSSGAMNLYADGASAGSATGPTASLTSPASIDFGRIQTGTNYFAGSIDEVAVYGSALSSSTASDHYKAGKGTG